MKSLRFLLLAFEKFGKLKYGMTLGGGQLPSNLCQRTERLSKQDEGYRPALARYVVPPERSSADEAAGI
jgi:hypothetical protein